MLYSCCLPVLFYQLLNNNGFCEYGTKWSGISERTSYQINLQHRVQARLDSLSSCNYSTIFGSFLVSGRVVPASTVFLDHSHSAARLPSAAGRAPPSSPTSTSAFNFPKFTFRTSNSLASSAPRTPFNPFARSAPPKVSPPTPAATQNTATSATSGLNFGSFYFFPAQFFPQQQPQYSAIIDFNPKKKPLHRPQGSTYI